MIFYLALKNIISRKSSIVIILFISFAVMLLVMTNAVFDSTEHGVEQMFENSCTGDLVIFPDSTSPLSLFGDETPVTGALTEIPHVVPYDEIVKVLSNSKEIESFIPQVSGQAYMEKDGRIGVCLFGVEGEQYIKMMNAITITKGQPFIADTKGVMISETLAQKINANVGDTVQFVVADGPTFRIRAAPVAALYTYEISNNVIDRIVLIDPATLRSLMEISNTVSNESIDKEKTNLLDNDFDIDSMFNDAGNVDAVVNEDQSKTQTLSSDKNIKETTIVQKSTSWNSIVCKSKNKKFTKRTIIQLNHQFKKNGWPVHAVNWRTAAGSTALYLYLMRLVLNIGIIIILVAGFIVVNNTLVINVLDRTREIGTLRAIGASRLFISLQCMIETFILAIMAGIIGSIFGCIAARIITHAQIVFKNAFLIQLFGGNALITEVTANNLGSVSLLVLVIGIVGWIYPVQAALKVNPVEAMQGAK